MECKWSQAPLGELISYISKGIVPKYTDDIVGSTIVLGQRCVRNQRVDYTQARFHDQKTKPFKPEKTVVLGDILINATGVGSAGRVAQVTVNPQQNCVTDGHVITLRAKGINPFYLGYFLKSRQSMIEQMAEGSTGQTEMNRSRLQNEIVVTFPQDNAAQTAIAQFGLSVDRKIAINNQINGYLEEWGQGLLEKYQESCATTIPLSDVMDFGNGYAFKSGSYIQNGLYKVLTIKNVQDGSVDCSMSNRIDELPPKMKPFCKLQPGNVVLSLTGNVGRVGIVPEENCLLNQRVAVFQPYNYALLPGLYFHFRQKAFQNEMIGIAKGTAQANLSPVETLKLEMPYNESFFEISQKLKPAFDLILANTIESKRLTVLRDALLPKLMCGKINVSKIDLVKLNSHLSGC